MCKSPDNETRFNDGFSGLCDIRGMELIFHYDSTIASATLQTWTWNYSMKRSRACLHIPFVRGQTCIELELWLAQRTKIDWTYQNNEKHIMCTSRIVESFQCILSWNMHTEALFMMHGKARINNNWNLLVHIYRPQTVLKPYRGDKPGPKQTLNQAALTSASWKKAPAGWAMGAKIVNRCCFTTGWTQNWWVQICPNSPEHVWSSPFASVEERRIKHVFWIHQPRKWWAFYHRYQALKFHSADRPIRPMKVM